MDTITLLVELATTAHHKQNLAVLLMNQSPRIKQAYAANNAELLKQTMSNTDYFANETHVVHRQC